MNGTRGRAIRRRTLDFANRTSRVISAHPAVPDTWALLNYKHWNTSPFHPETATTIHYDIESEFPMNTLSTISTATATWVLDPVHSRIGFAVKHLGISTIRGSFAEFEGKLETGDAVSQMNANGVVDAASIDTRFRMRDDHLRSADFFDVENHPKIAFQSTAIKALDKDRFEATGNLTIRGVTRPITLSGTVRGMAIDQFDNERLGLDASGQLSRAEFGMPYDGAVAGIPIAADTVTLTLDIEAIRQA